MSQEYIRIYLCSTFVGLFYCWCDLVGYAVKHPCLLKTGYNIYITFHILMLLVDTKQFTFGWKITLSHSFHDSYISVSNSLSLSVSLDVSIDCYFKKLHFYHSSIKNILFFVIDILTSIRSLFWEQFYTFLIGNVTLKWKYFGQLDTAT